jgi:hypothetical protein
MKPMPKTEAWWPKDLGEPSSSGAQNDIRYAFFADARRLLVEDHGKTSTYDSGDHRISGVSQQQSGSSSLAFTSQKGTVDVGSLKKLD